MKSKTFIQWKRIIVVDDSQTEIAKYDLNEDERLKKKMKRLKKRSLIHSVAARQEKPALPIPNVNESTSKIFHFYHQVIFSYNENPRELDIEKDQIEIPNPSVFTNSNTNEEINASIPPKKMILINDIIDSCHPDLKK